MNSVKFAVSLMVFLFASSYVLLAQKNKIEYPQEQYNLIEVNYLKGLNEGNEGIQASCAYFLGDMKSQKAVIPLMKMFKESNNDGMKLIAAWSLLKIGDARGVFMVSRAIDLGECSPVYCMLFHLYKDYELKKSIDVAIK